MWLAATNGFLLAWEIKAAPPQSLLGRKSTMSGKPADQDASVSMVSTSEISAVDRLTSEWMACVMRLPHGVSLTSIAPAPA